jgi:hypothetical protein
MRDLYENEYQFVSGAGSAPSGPSGCCCSPSGPRKRTKNNNGYGNGPESGPPPGNSGAHNPQLTGPNRGPRGRR